jgi:anaerobic magnesium-protoporphyrin IX monomethyl ester cyclase
MTDKILLYYPKTAGEEDSRPLYCGLPLSVLTLAAQLDASRYDIRIVDGRVEEDAYSKVIDWIDDNVMCIGLSSMTSYQIRDGLTLAQMIKNLYPRMPIVWGGWHPSLMPDQTIQHQLVDALIVGQGEIAFPALVSQLASKRDWSTIPNIIYKDEDGCVKHTPRRSVKFSETEPIERGYPYIDVENYIQPLWGNERVVGYETSRGCPWNCDFCSIGAVYTRRWSALPPNRVVDGVEYLSRHHHVDAIHFFDNNFFVDAHRASNISSFLVDRGLKIRWDGTAIVEQFLNFTPDYLAHLMESGFYRVIVGVESGDEQVLKMIGKRHENHHVIEMVEKCAQLGIMASISFMVGFPWNPEKDVAETIRLIERIKEIDPRTEILLFVFSPYLGTKMFYVSAEYGMVFPQSLEGWADYTYDRVNTPWITERLRRKIDRYISFFGTKDMSDEIKNFVVGGMKASDMAHR